jgi:hypothetical protein
LGMKNHIATTTTNINTIIIVAMVLKVIYYTFIFETTFPQSQCNSIATVTSPSL